MQCSTMVQGFTGSTEVDLPLPCTYDFEVTGVAVPARPRDGGVPLLLLFSGTVFTRGAAGFAVEQVPWDREARYELPVARLAGPDAPALPGHGVAAAGPRRPWRARRRTGPARPGHMRNDEALADLLTPAAGEGRDDHPEPR